MREPSTDTGGGSSHAGDGGASGSGAGGGHGHSDTGGGSGGGGRDDDGLLGAGRVDDGTDASHGDHRDGPGGDEARASERVPPHTGLDAPPPHTGADAPALPLDRLEAINDEFRMSSGAVDPSRMDEWADAVSDAYPALTPDQAKAIYWYTTDEGYDAINPYLRAYGDAPADVDILESRISDLTQGLANLPAEATPGHYFSRGVTMTPQFLDQFHTGQQWSDPSFMSTTTDPLVARDFAFQALSEGKTPGVFTIDGVTPSSVSPLSRYATEAELLYQRSTTFDVLSKFEDANGVWRIHLREVRE